MYFCPKRRKQGRSCCPVGKPRLFRVCFLLRWLLFPASLCGVLVFGWALPRASASSSRRLLTQLVHTRLVHTQLVHSQLVHAQLTHVQLVHLQLVHTHNFLTHNLLTHNFLTHNLLPHNFAWQALHLATSTHTQLAWPS